MKQKISPEILQQFIKQKQELENTHMKKVKE